LSFQSLVPSFVTAADIMVADAMEIEVAEQKLKSMEHAEQHYFNR